MSGKIAKNIGLLAFILVVTLLPVSLSRSALGGNGGWSAIDGSGYAVTSNWHGIDVTGYQEVTITAGTTRASIHVVIFRWNDPAGNTVWEDTVPVSGPLTTPQTPPEPIPDELEQWATTNPDVTYFYAQAKRTPNIPGDWGVQAFFIGADGRSKAGLEDVVTVRATSFNLIPEVPILGTAGAGVMMALGLGLFVRRQKKNTFS